ncbi:OmpA family protein [Candidatus Marithrix sp. Canyon 246]|uniref:OmpA family protein n=1 Tax=Candidatus Marithrix sp. Canyon 246 TaxID=1827136 RepID=UPI00084A253B|nr:OmpA family protein [Candidatus Marithrix sp. Canyon 246]
MKYKSIGILTLCYTFNSFAGDNVIIYDQVPTKAQLLRDLMPYQPVMTRSFGRTRSISPSPCNMPNFQDKIVGITIRFKVNQFNLTPKAREFADLLGDVLAADQLLACDFEIEGHTDSSGRAYHNTRLSKQRANTVVSYLINAHSINPARLKAKGYGEYRLLNGKKYSTNPINRRVQIRNVGKF